MKANRGRGEDIEITKDLLLQDENQIAEWKLVIIYVKTRYGAEKVLDISQLSKAGIFREQQRNCETLRGAFKDAEREEWVSKFVDTQFNIDNLKTVQIKCVNIVLIGVIDTGTQIKIALEDLVTDTPYNGERK
ncbi:hypothetical protein CEXT_85241 [Caerostris extrusa]|uniref:Uncharacterized protein n=1 Tax=Caerostris extrusa TaxID=172846 RepID=A0AAV4WST6_CAEEX|nr:hypothetical protein CEXT_85241 [Caerostris extrusa]